MEANKNKDRGQLRVRSKLERMYWRSCSFVVHLSFSITYRHEHELLSVLTYPALACANWRLLWPAWGVQCVVQGRMVVGLRPWMMQLVQWMEPKQIQLFSGHQLHLFSPHSLTSPSLCLLFNSPPARGVGLCVYHTISLPCITRIRIASKFLAGNRVQSQWTLGSAEVAPFHQVYLIFMDIISRGNRKVDGVLWGGAQDCLKVRDHRHYDLSFFLCWVAGLILKAKLYRCRLDTRHHELVSICQNTSPSNFPALRHTRKSSMFTAFSPQTGTFIVPSLECLIFGARCCQHKQSDFSGMKEYFVI